MEQLQFDNLCEHDQAEFAAFHDFLNKANETRPVLDAYNEVYDAPKQVIVVRKDLNMRKGKIAAQVAHASMAVILAQMECEYNELYSTRKLVTIDGSPLANWLDDAFTKIVVSVDSEEELLQLVKKAEHLGIPCSLITDNGKTEFNGVKTNTCAAFGPDLPIHVDYITRGLKLL